MRFITVILIFFVSNQLAGQCDTLRYIHPIFNSITVHSDVVYGEGQVWYFPYNNTELTMDIYEPEDDTLSNRPLMVWVHPGGFLAGSKDADDMVALCDSFARRGYVTASINYRLGFNPLSSNSAERAVYRGVQDTRAAIRFLKENYQNYGIDTNYTFVGGSSAGGFAALHLAYMNQNQAPSSIDGGLTYPDLGCLDCSGNNFQHSSQPDAIVNLYGAIGDSSWITASDTIPALLAHGTNDGVVPYGVGHPFGVFTTPITHGSRSISNQLSSLNIAHESLVFQGEGHEPHGTSNGNFNGAPTPYWDTIFSAIQAHYFTILKPDIPIINVPEEVCLFDTIVVQATAGDFFCWSGANVEIIEETGNSATIVFTETGPQSINVRNYSSVRAHGFGQSATVMVNDLPNSTFDYTLDPPNVNFSASTLGYTNYIWNFDDGTVINGISPVHTYSFPGIYFPSLTVTDANGCSSSSSVTIDYSTLLTMENNIEDQVIIYPNPFSSLLNISAYEAIQTIQIFDGLGREVFKEDIATTKEASLNLTSLSNGFYTIRITFSDHRIYTGKIEKL